MNTTKKKTNPVQFFREVESEAKKVTWPTRKETVTTTAIVMVMVALMGVFFLVADKLAAWFVRFVLTFGL